MWGGGGISMGVFFRGNVVCLTGAPRGREAVVRIIRKKKKKNQMRRR